MVRVCLNTTKPGAFTTGFLATLIGTRKASTSIGCPRPFAGLLQGWQGRLATVFQLSLVLADVAMPGHDGALPFVFLLRVSPIVAVA